MSIRGLLFASAVSLLISFTPARADVDMFLCSASIPGEATASGFADCNELLAVGENIEFLANGEQKPANSIDLLPVTIRKAFDLGSPLIRLLALTGELFDGVITFRRTGDSPFVFFEMDMRDVRVVNVEIDNGGEVPTETVIFLPGRIIWTYTKQRSDGSADGTTTFSWDVKSGMSF